MVCNLISESNDINIPNVLAMIGLYGPPDSYVYDSYTNLAKPFDFNVKQISSLQLTFLKPDGTQYNFNNLDHSFTIEIVAEFNELINSNQSTRTG